MLELLDQMLELLDQNVFDVIVFQLVVVLLNI